MLIIKYSKRIQYFIHHINSLNYTNAPDYCKKAKIYEFIGKLESLASIIDEIEMRECHNLNTTIGSFCVIS